MANTGFICQDAYLAKTGKLTDEQLGRLFRALMIYHISGKPTDLPPLEEIAFDFIREDIDKADAAYKAKCEQNSRNRRSTPDNDRQRSSTIVNDRQELEKPVKALPDEGFITEDEAGDIQKDHDRILDAAEDAGFKMSNDVRSALIALYAEYGLDKMLNGFKECSEHSASTLAYLRAVLKGKPKQAKINPNSAHNFTERDYSGVDAELMAELEKDMDEYVKTGKTRIDREREKKTVPAQQYEQRDYKEVQERLEQQQTERVTQRLKTCENCRNGETCIKRKTFEKSGGCQTFVSK